MTEQQRKAIEILHKAEMLRNKFFIWTIVGWLLAVLIYVILK